MSEYRFDVKTIEHSLKKQAIEILFSLDLDEDSLNANNVILAVLDKGAQRMVPFELLVDGELLTLKLQEWAVPNQKYTLLIQPGIQSITEETLDHAIMRNFVFESEITTDVQILSPSNFETVTETFLSWNEIGDSPVGQFYLEIAKDNAFYDIVLKTTSGGLSYATDKLTEDRQYFFRVRAQLSEEAYGQWSEIRTFRLHVSNETSPVPTDEPEQEDDSSGDILDPIIIDDEDVQEDLSIVSKPQNGITPIYFAFVFSEDIDASEAVIDVVRSDF